MSKGDLQQYALFSYSLAALRPKEKVKAIRTLFGYTDRKQHKTYEHTGLIDEHEGKKIGPTVIAVPIGQSVAFSNFFGSNRIKVEVKEVWMR